MMIISFETGRGLYRQCLALNTTIYKKTMKVEGNKLVVVDAQPVEDSEKGFEKDSKLVMSPLLF